MQPGKSTAGQESGRGTRAFADGIMDVSQLAGGVLACARRRTGFRVKR